MNKEPKTPTTDQVDKRIVTQLVCALIASGKYIGEDEDNGRPFIIHTDHGKEWKERLFYAKETYDVITDALELLDNIESACKLENELMADYLAQ